MNLAENKFEPETEMEKREVMKEKLYRYKTIVTKKDKILKATVEQVKSMKLSIETLKHDVNMSAEVEQNKETLIKEKKAEVSEATKKYKHIEKELKSVKDQNNINIDSPD